MSKYYTPKLEEFHIGFEIMAPDEKGEYHPISINAIALELIASRANYDEVKHNNLMLDYEEFRVKYLDQEDIESLGFKCKQSEYMNQVTEGILHNIKNFNILLLQDRDTNVVTLYRMVGIDYNTRDIMFGGLIKNKSELKKVLQMIGVLEDV